MSENVLKVENLVGYYKGTFGTIYAVDNVSLYVKKGEIVGIAGESGCGKSTLAELISGIPRPLLYFEKGLIEIEGYDIYRIDKETLRTEVLCQTLGYVPQASMNSLNPVVKIKDFLLDVMKQRTKQLYTINRKVRITNRILVKSLNNLSKYKLEKEISHLVKELLHHTNIIQIISHQFPHIFSKVISSYSENPFFISIVNRFPDKIQEQIKNHESIDEKFLQTQLLSTLKGITPEILGDFLNFLFSHSTLWNTEDDVFKLLNMTITKKNYKKLWPSLKEILHKALQIMGKSEIDPSWYFLFPEEVTGVPVPPIPNNKTVLQQAIKHMEKLGLDPKVLDSYPHELSGGMKQRTVIAISTLFNPKLLIADEPTSALDVSTQKKLLELLLQLINQHIVESILFISHDIPTLRQICTRIIVMYGGKIMEDAELETIVNKPLHPYTQCLTGAIASFNPNGCIEGELCGIKGRPPDLREPPKGCRFNPRCGKVMEICKEQEPPAFEHNGKNHLVKCWLYKD